MDYTPWITLAVPLVAGLGYLIKRRITRAGTIDGVDRRLKLAELNKSLRDQDITVADLDALEAEIDGKRAASLREAADQLDAIDAAPGGDLDAAPAGALEQDFEARGYEPRTQAAMNMLAHSRLVEAEARLSDAFTEIMLMVDERERPLLQAAQDAWESYRDRQAEFAAAEFEGGSIQPLIRSSQMRSITLARVAELESDIRYRKDL